MDGRPEAPPERERFSKLTMRGLQWVWLATAIVALSSRRVPGITRVLLLVPLLYFIVHLLYVVDVYYPRHIIAGHLALGLSLLCAAGRGWS